jgi:hypothetical protein
MSTIPSPNCPYKGLQPYTEEDRKYFFGRERDKEVVASNLYVTPLTVLYGGSGVGKSSVLQAGVIPKLKAKPRTAIVYFNEWQSDAFERALKRQVLDAACRAKGLTPAEALKTVSAALEEAFEGDGRGGRREPGASAAEDFTLDDLLLGCARGLHLRMLLIFDQFEEYFLYHTPGTSAEGFDAEFARAVNQHDDGVNFMLSMREEELSKLDRFRVRIPNLLTNLLRLENLDREAAAEAIARPLDVYNEEHPEARKSIEDKLVEAILQQVGPENLSDGAGGQQPAAAERKGAVRIETPFLQVVLTRLWEEERRLGSDTLRLDTLNELGGAKNIARTHLDEVMSKLDEGERDTAAAVLRFLVTPAGAKIAQQPSALASWAELEPSAVRNVLTHLSSRQEMCILRKVTVPAQEERYELFHDVLGPAILNWQSRYTQARRLARQRADAEERIRKERKRVKRLAVAMAGLVILLIGMGTLTAYALRKRGEAEVQRVESNRQKAEAERQKGNAEEQERIAKNALAEVASARDRANEQKIEAEKQKKLAEGQKEEALRAQEREAEARRAADGLKIEADRQARLATERALEAERANKQMEIEALKGTALSHLMDRRINEAVASFKELDERYGERKDPAGRVYANLKIADIYRDESFMDLFTAELVGVTPIEDSGDEGADAAIRQMYSRMTLQASQYKNEKDMLKAMADGVDKGTFFYQQARDYNKENNGPDRLTREGEILNKLGDVRLGQIIVKAMVDAPERAQKLTEEERRKEILKVLEFYEQARVAYHAAGLPFEEAQLYRKMASLLRAAEELQPSGAALKPPDEKQAEETERQIIDIQKKAADSYVRAQLPLAAAHMHKSIGDLHAARKEGRPDKLESAVKEYELALGIYRDNRKEAMVAATTDTLAGFYTELDKTDLALDYYKQAYAAYRRAKSLRESTAASSREESDTLKKIARLMVGSAGGEASLRKYVEDEMSAAGVDAVGRAQTFAGIGDFFKEQDGKAAEALWYYGRERQAWREARRPREEGNTLFKIGKLQIEIEDTPAALRSFGEARKAYAEVAAAPPEPNNVSYGSNVSNLTEMAAIYAKHDVRAAGEVYHEALGGGPSDPSHHGWAVMIIREAGKTLNGAGSPEAGREFVGIFQKALDRLRAAKDAQVEAAALTEIGDVYAPKSRRPEGGAVGENLREAVKYYELARAVYLQSRSISNASSTLKKIADAKIAAGEPEQAAVDYLTAVAAAAAAAKDFAGEGSALEALAIFYREGRDWRKSFGFYEQARRAYAAGGLTPEVISAIRAMAYLLQMNGEKTQGDKLMREAEALSRKTI